MDRSQSLERTMWHYNADLAQKMMSISFIDYYASKERLKCQTYMD